MLNIICLHLIGVTIVVLVGFCFCFSPWWQLLTLGLSSHYTGSAPQGVEALSGRWSVLQ